MDGRSRCTVIIVAFLIATCCAKPPKIIVPDTRINGQLEERFSVTCNVGTQFCYVHCINTGFKRGKCIDGLCHCFHFP